MLKIQEMRIAVVRGGARSSRRPARARSAQHVCVATPRLAIAAHTFLCSMTAFPGSRRQVRRHHANAAGRKNERCDPSAFAFSGDLHFTGAARRRDEVACASLGGDLLAAPITSEAFCDGSDAEGPARSADDDAPFGLALDGIRTGIEHTGSRHMRMFQIRTEVLASLALLMFRLASAQELVISTARNTTPPIVAAPTIIFPDLGAGLPYPATLIVAPEPNGGFPPYENAHGLALFGIDRAVTTRVTTNEIHVIDTANAVTVSEFVLPGFNGIGTLAIDPAQTKLFALTGDQDGSNTLYLVDAPFNASSAVTTLTLPGNGGTANSHAITFDQTSGRAFVGHSTGISVIDPPYTSIAFTIPVAGQDDPRVGQLVALSPDGTILATTTDQSTINILHAPFSASSAPIVLAPPGAQYLGGAAFTPNADTLLVTDAASGPSVIRAFAVSAPFDASATIEALPIPDDLVSSGLEDIDISADGQLAALTGNDLNTSQPLIILKAPFTAAGTTVYPIHIPLMPDYTPYGGRGAGTARFRSGPLAATPQFSPDAKYFFAREGDSGQSPLRIDVHLSHASNQIASVDYATFDSSAIAGVDYVAATGTLVFAPGETRKSFHVDLIGNTTGDFNTRLFDVRFSNAVNASISQNLAGIRCEIADEENSFGSGIMLTPDHLPDGRLAAPYTATLTSSFAGGDGVWRVLQGELPPGLILDLDTGAISGTPTYPGTYWFIVEAAHTPGGFYNLTIPRPGDTIFADGFDSA